MVPCCFHPTRVVIVDESHELMNIVETRLNRSHMTFNSFSTPVNALHYINEIYQPEPFYDRYMVKKENASLKGRRLEVSVIDTHQEIYRPQRFDQISTTVLDVTSYHSPKTPLDMAVIEFFKRVQDPHIQKILLVDERDEQFIEQTLSDGTIHYCICKQDFDWIAQFYEALQSAQWRYFKDLSEVFMKTNRVPNESPYAITDPNFQSFFKAILTNYGFSEAYLCESTGSYLFLDSQAQDHGLIVNLPEQLDFWVTSGQTKGIKVPLLKELKNRKKMICYHNSFDGTEPDKRHWEIYAHPANTLKGKNTTFYYAFAPNLYDIDVERILPFKEYRENQQRKVSRLH
jgi:hypothetical protein